MARQAAGAEAIIAYSVGPELATLAQIMTAPMVVLIGYLSWWAVEQPALTRKGKFVSQLHRLLRTRRP